jgi:hypothetical protein
LPCAVRGPVERWALARLAEALRSLTGGFEVGGFWAETVSFIGPRRRDNHRLTDAHADSIGGLTRGE